MAPFRMVAYACCALLSIVFVPAMLIWLICEKLCPRTFRRPADGQPLRVAYLITDVWTGTLGGAASHKMGFCRGLTASGHTPIALFNTPVPGVESVVKEYHLVPPPVLPNGMPITIGVLVNNIVFLWRALRILQPLRSDMVAQRHSELNYAGIPISRALHVPFILEYNSGSSFKSSATDRSAGLVRPLRRLIEYINLAAADRIVVVSEVLKQSLVERGVASARIVVNPNGADAEMFRPGIDANPLQERLQLRGKTTVGFAGFYGPWHGVEYLAKAVRLVLNIRQDVQFLFIGDEKLVDLVSNIAENDGTKSVITCLTHVPHSEMPCYYSACDILVSPHVHMVDGGTFLGSPVKIFEYMAMGKPIVASGVGQIADLLKDGYNALLTKPGDVQGIAEAILTLSSDPELRCRLGQAARETCLSSCTWKHNAERFIAAYREVAQSEHH